MLCDTELGDRGDVSELEYCSVTCVLTLDALYECVEQNESIVSVCFAMHRRSEDLDRGEHLAGLQVVNFVPRV